MSLRLIGLLGLVIVVLLLGPCGRASVGTIDLPDGRQLQFHSALSVDAEPLQVPLDWPYPALRLGDFSLSPVAEFQIEAKILSRRDYRWDTESALSPIDLLLGWGRMADPDIVAQIRFRQAGRFGYWRVAEFPIPRREIETSSANIHLIPTDPAVYRTLRRARAGQSIRMVGYLVNVDRADGWRWRTSLTREDTGSGACEILLVTLVELI